MFKSIGFCILCRNWYLLHTGGHCGTRMVLPADGSYSYVDTTDSVICLDSRVTWDT